MRGLKTMKVPTKIKNFAFKTTHKRILNHRKIQDGDTDRETVGTPSSEKKPWGTPRERGIILIILI
jgi:hypothetical protein